jgi:hypothetical protein
MYGLRKARVCELKQATNVRGMGGREREREIHRQRERERERERDCLLIGTEIVSSIVMYNLGVGPWGTL